MMMIQPMTVIMLITMLMMWARVLWWWRWYGDDVPGCYDVGDTSGGVDIMEVEYGKDDDDCGYVCGPLHAYDILL